jgi:hypothetical protein
MPLDRPGQAAWTRVPWRMHIPETNAHTFPRLGHTRRTHHCPGGHASSSDRQSTDSGEAPTRRIAWRVNSGRNETGFVWNVFTFIIWPGTPRPKSVPSIRCPTSWSHPPRSVCSVDLFFPRISLSRANESDRLRRWHRARARMMPWWWQHWMMASPTYDSIPYVGVIPFSWAEGN